MQGIRSQPDQRFELMKVSNLNLFETDVAHRPNKNDIKEFALEDFKTFSAKVPNFSYMHFDKKV